MHSGLDGTIESMNANNLIVRNEARERSLPQFYVDQVKPIANVRAVYSVTDLDGYFQVERNRVRAFALGGGLNFSVMTEYRIPQTQFETFKQTRNGAMVGRKLADEYGWKIGDRVPLVSQKWVQRDRSPIWTFDIVGIYDRPTEPDLANDFWLNYEYLDQGRVKGKGSVDLLLVRTVNPKANAQVAADIDRLFANSSSPTVTQTQRELLLSTVDQVLNVSLIVNAIVGASFFTLLLLTVTSMMESGQQRVPEFAVLKACGVPDGTVFMLIVSEGLTLCVLAGAAGLVVAAVLFPKLAAVGGLNGIGIPSQVVIEGLLIAVGIALASAAAPAWRAKRLSVVDALVRQH